MFVTNDSAKISECETIEHTGVHWWHYVTVTQDRPYFLACYRLGDRLCSDLISSVWQIRQLVCEPELSLLDVQLIIGLTDTEQVRWAMRPLESVSIGKERSADSCTESLIYILSDGSRVVDSEHGSAESDLVDIEEWFSVRDKKVRRV